MGRARPAGIVRRAVRQPRRGAALRAARKRQPSVRRDHGSGRDRARSAATASHGQSRHDAGPTRRLDRAQVFPTDMDGSTRGTRTAVRHYPGAGRPSRWRTGPILEQKMIRHIRNEPGAFSPDLIRILSIALDEAWQSANAEQLSISLEHHEIAVRDLLARHIIDMAKKGERDRARLVENALYRLKL